MNYVIHENLINRYSTILLHAYNELSFSKIFYLFCLGFQRRDVSFQFAVLQRQLGIEADGSNSWNRAFYQKTGCRLQKSLRSSWAGRAEKRLGSERPPNASDTRKQSRRRVFSAAFLPALSLDTALISTNYARLSSFLSFSFFSRFHSYRATILLITCSRSLAYGRKQNTDPMAWWSVEREQTTL